MVGFMGFGAQCKMVVGRNTNNRLAVCFIYMVGFMGLDAQCKMVVGHNANNRMAVGPFRGQGCERSELPCLASVDRKLGRRSWSFYI